ncbi:MAG: magnesium transporter CorA family protein, partial [Streptococcaceae bacterium]|nr:magnesium transporter CorA family protein [Streptococcaceae bacterium]
VLNRTYHREHLAHEIINQILSDLTHAFHSYLRRFRFQKRDLERELRKSVENELIISMIGMNTSLIYFEDALQNNREVLEELIEYLKDKNQDGFADRIYDTFVETDQAFSETRIQLKLLEHLRDLFSSIVSNNLNTIMKIMTSATFVLGIPAAIAGIYGMNVPIPEQTSRFAFFGILFGTAIFCGIVVYVLRKKNML